MSHHHHVSMLVCVLWGPIGLGAWFGLAVLWARKRPMPELESGE
jgi:hypothetical protein